MEDTKEFTKGKSKVVTSPIGKSRQNLNQEQNTSVGATRPMPKKADEIADLLARLMDVMHSWSKVTDEKLPMPLISTNHVLLAFPSEGLVIRNVTNADGTHNFSVDGKLVIPVTSGASE